jgi:uncharacterized protein (TIGR02246 family)
MKVNQVACVAFLALSGFATSLKADDLGADMEAVNARWNAAFNAGNAQALPAMYTKDAVVLPPGAKPVTGGPEAIAQFWEGIMKLGVKEHTFTIVSAHSDGKFAYQNARWTANLVKATGEKTPLSGNNVRVFERQPDGSWRTKVHIHNAD